MALGACGDAAPSGTTALFDPSNADFYALPFPNDLRRHTDGTLDLSAFPAKVQIVQEYRDAAAAALDGFGLNTTAFARFSAPIDPATLPDIAGSTQPGASVYLVDIDPASPKKDARIPAIVHFLADPRGTAGENNLSARPYPGFSFEEGTIYALVITSRVHDTTGAPVEATAAFTKELHAGGAYKPLADWLAANPDDVVDAAVFTTQHATRIVPALRKGVLGTPAPVATGIQIVRGAVFELVTGMYPAPNFQVGTVPYSNANGGGNIVVGSDGVAVVQRTENLRFAMTTPLTPMPATGWPIVLYQHGTGGDWMSFIQDGTAQRLVNQGLAVISMDQVLHGPRNPGGDPEVDFFNVANPQAIRDNIMQGTADAFSQLRLVQGFAIPDGASTITVDPTKVYFFGHSQGSETGPGFVAFEPTLKGAVLSGCAGLVYMAVLYKKSPGDLAGAVETLIRDEPYDEDNPTLALLQMWMEHSDPLNYAHLMVREPIAGNSPRDIFQTEGFTDTYAPNPGIEAFATALGGDLVKTADVKDLPGIDLRGRAIVTPPITDNLGSVTAVLAQYKQKSGSDGHFVVFDIPAAQQQSSQFLGTLAATGHATVVVPQ